MNRNKNNYPEYSVLMSVYRKDDAAYFDAAMDSIWNQTIKTNDFVLICDGPLTQEIEEVIERQQKTHSDLRVIRLEKNSGLGNALNVGLKECKNDLVARMDSDDISREDRCEKQILCFINKPEIDICSGTVEEFDTSPEVVIARRSLPQIHEDIVCFAKRRTPFNHPCVMYKKRCVEDAGGYKDFYLLEDYFLWIRMLQNGCIGYNLSDSLLWMRAGKNMYKRRSGRKYMISQIKLFKYMRDTYFISDIQYVKSVIIRSVSSMSPNIVRMYMYRIFNRM